MRHNRLTTSINKDSKLERLLRDILGEIRASRIFSSSTVRASRKAHGTTLEVLREPFVAPSPIKQFKVISENYNYLSCKEWTGDDTSTDLNPPVLVAKPVNLRLYLQKPQHGTVASYDITQWGHTLNVSLRRTPDGLSFYTNVRDVTFGGGGITSLADTYTEFIDPPYLPTFTVPDPLPEGWQENLRGKLIFACKPSGGVGYCGWDFNAASGAVSQPTIEWLDMNFDGRQWRKEIQICDGGVARYQRYSASEIYGGTIVPPNT